MHLLQSKKNIVKLKSLKSVEKYVKNAPISCPSNWIEDWMIRLHSALPYSLSNTRVADPDVDLANPNSPFARIVSGSKNPFKTCSHRNLVPKILCYVPKL